MLDALGRWFMPACLVLYYAGRTLVIAAAFAAGVVLGASL